jgi:hypothetical protein
LKEENYKGALSIEHEDSNYLGNDEKAKEGLLLAKNNIQQWLSRGNRTDPNTRQQITTTLIPNFSIKSLINSYIPQLGGKRKYKKTRKTNNKMTKNIKKIKKMKKNKTIKQKRVLKNRKYNKKTKSKRK